MRKIFLLLALFILPGTSYALCGLSAPTATFGSVTTFAVGSTVQNTSSTTNVNCGSGTLSLLGTDNVTYAFTTATYLSGARAVLKTASTGTDSIPIQMCIDSACASELTQGSNHVYSSSALLTLGSTLNFNIPLYFRTVPGQVIAAGSYTTTITLTVSYTVCAGLNVAGLCVGTVQTSTGTAMPITVNLVVTNDCTTITAPNVSFGSAPLVGSFSTVQQTINVVCSKGSTFTVGLSNGSYNSGTTRQMASGTNRLAYDIYKGTTTTTRWGPTGTDRWSSVSATSLNADLVTRNFTYTAQILTTQNTPAAGSYTDSVVVDLSF
ncbi:spore coat U domain-containing protein [Pantoea sp. JGM49]|uniref:Csu type fimbrial protein n=1 Tax=unclassified Pantoea TaxID=2630326 RepID=UPI001BA96638|nr:MULTISPECIES: spore coat protein U domain-containing protein [unclassified Pantoea]MBS0881186.1 spore coat U domain-containing protein [Pantoea sp. JGM49]